MTAPNSPTTTEELGGERTPGTRPASDATPTLARGELVGRYVVLEPIGSGGMGRVYLALDPYLERKIAIKLVRDRAVDGQARLLREAQAMARLAHPNVVAVHDVGTVGDQVFLAMEYCDGHTLRHWLDERPRSWREIVPVFLAAGRGLAAAHAAGIVHRDFKPDNVVMGKDGRVCVTDFGLALGESPAGDVAATGAGPASDRTPTPVPGRAPSRITRVGTIVGTPGYVAPELLAGGVPDSRADQFSFCVALHVALHGRRPTAPGVGADTDVLAPRRERAVPSRLSRLLARGLDVDPARRFADMNKLLGALDKISTSRRRLAAGIGAVVVLAAAIGIVAARWFATMPAAPPRPCTGASDRLEEIWDAPMRERMARSFAAVGMPYGETTLAATTAALDEYARAWTGMHTEACEATRVRGAQSDEVLTLRMVCLDRRLGELGSLTQLLANADRSVVDRASQAAAALTPVATCADVEELRRPHKAPGSPEQQAAIAAHLAEARVAWTLGRPAGSAAADRAITLARALGARAFESEGLLLRGYLEITAGKLAEARATLLAALTAAEAAGHDVIAVNAASRMAVVLGYSLGKPEDGMPWLALASAIAERLGNPPAVEIERLSVAGILANRRGDPAEAVRFHREAAELGARTHGADALVQWKRYADLGASYFEAGESRRAIVELEHALALKRRFQGDGHPDVAMLSSNLAAAHSRLGDSERALDLLKQALAIRERLAGPDSPLLVIPLNNVASTLVDMGRADEAVAVARRAIAIGEASLGPDNLTIVYALTTLGGALAATGDHRQAEAVLTEALGRVERVGGKEHVAVAGTLETFIELRRRQGRHRDVLALAERAIALRERAQGAEAADLAPPLLAAGRALLALGQPARARVLLERARVLCDSGRAPAPACGDAKRALAAAVDRAGPGTR